MAAGIAPAAPEAPAKVPLPDSDEEAYPAIQRYIQVMDSIRARHPDVDKVGYERLTNHALEGMLASLDPFSSYIHPEMARAMKEHPDLKPDVPSLGITVGLRDDGPYISNVWPKYPAAKAGLIPGAAILECDGSPPPGYEELLAHLKKPGGSTTRLKVKQETNPKPLEVTLIHRVVPEKNITDSHLIPGTDAGYIHLAQFSEGCALEMEHTLDDLEDAGMKRLILDLRQNGGGLVDETVRILGFFLPPSTAVVTTRGRGGVELDKPMLTPAKQRRTRSYPISVLIDSMSASASELTAGALQDLKRARIIGEVSYGKGSVQNIIPMDNGTALRLTFATYHTPSGRTPHHVGITPDIPVPLSEEDRRKIEQSFHRQTLSADELKTLESWTDPVISAALK